MDDAPHRRTPFALRWGLATVAAAVVASGCGGDSDPGDDASTVEIEVAEQVRMPSILGLLPTVAAPKPAEGHATQRATRLPSRRQSGVNTGEPNAPSHRMAKQALDVRAGPDHRAPIRGRIPIAAVFEVVGWVDGDGCAGKGWADVGNGGFVCAQDTRPAGRHRPRMLPRMRGHGANPYYYAKVDKGMVARRWRSLAAFDAGKSHVGVLEVGHDYAFETRRRRKGRIVLVDAAGGVVLEDEVRRYRPSTFAGRDLVADPVPPGQSLVWTVTWPESPVLAKPQPETELAASLDYHLELVVGPAVKNEHGTWYMAQGGFVHTKHLRRFAVAEPPTEIDGDEVWVDVDVQQQTLAVMRGHDPVFATLISSGFKAPTPRGVFRVHLKQALGDMSSQPGADKPYTVEAVPFVQYFLAGFALHGAYWHNRFGHPISHGCVNLSPRDAKRVFELTAPRAVPGWLHVHETRGHEGTTVRVRKGAVPVQDRRGPVEPTY